jgi:Leu/Phe-tRNA-protein transferase
MQSDDSYLLTCLITYKNRDHWDSRRDRSLLSYRQEGTRELKMASFKKQLIDCRQQASKQASKGARELKMASFKKQLIDCRQQASKGARELKMASFKKQLINCRQQASKQRRARDEKDFLFQSPYERPATHQAP